MPLVSNKNVGLCLYILMNQILHLSSRGPDDWIKMVLQISDFILFKEWLISSNLCQKGSKQKTSFIFQHKNSIWTAYLKEQEQSCYDDYITKTIILL